MALTLDSKLPVPFRKDLKNLIKNRLEGIAVPIDIRETLIAFPTPRPQPPAPREMPFSYPPMPQMQQQPPQPAERQPAPAPPPPVPRDPSGRSGTPIWIAIALAIAGLVIGALVMALLAARRRPGTAQAQGRRQARRRRQRAPARPPRPPRPPPPSITCPTSGARCARIACWPAA